jgi:hypothetical protein
MPPFDEVAVDALGMLHPSDLVDGIDHRLAHRYGRVSDRGDGRATPSMRWSAEHHPPLRPDV